MATTAHHPRRLSRKELRQPDEFVSFFDAAGDYLANNLLRVILGGVGLLAVIFVVVGARFYLDRQNRAAADAFYQAINALDRKDYPQAAAQFATLASDYPSTSLSRLAPFYVANAELAQNQSAKARVALQKYLDVEDRPHFRELALMQLGVACEDSGDYAAARKSYEQAAALNGPEQRRAEMNLGRLQVRLGDKTAAIATYQRVLHENPYGPESGAATEALAQLGVTAPSPAPSALR
jgi:predicted negative regulator of RcsB-dependent stress response